MGADESVQRQGRERAFDTFMYAPVTTHRREADYTARFMPANNPRTVQKTKETAPLLNTAYRGVWSMTMPTTLGPAARMGQCTVYDKQKDALVIAYGVDGSGTHFNDAWALDLHTLTWRLVSRSLLEPRAYASAVLVDRFMIVFGGACHNTFFADLHAINVDTGEVIRIPFGGDAPCARTSPMLFERGGRLFLWGGYDGTAQAGVYTIDVKGGNWSLISQTHSGLPAPACCIHDDVCYVFGGVDGSPMSIFEPELGTFRPMPCLGTEPPVDLARCALVSGDEFIFLVGGEASFDYMHLFALEVRRNWWFAFHVRPDNDTLSTSDGIVNKIGLFMLPREHSASVVYSPRERELVGVLGSRMREPPPIFRVHIGEALAVIHLRSDMLEVLLATQKMSG